MSSHSCFNRAHWRPLSDTERKVLARLLDVDFPGKGELLEQARELRARTLDAEGGIALLPAASAPAAEVVRRIPVEAEFEDFDGTTVHMLLHVVGGFLNELEIYRDDSGSIQRDIGGADLRLIVL